MSKDPLSRRRLLQPLLDESAEISTAKHPAAPRFRFEVTRVQAEIAHLNGDQAGELTARKETLRLAQMLANGGDNDEYFVDSYLEFQWARFYFRYRSAAFEQRRQIQYLTSSETTDGKTWLDELGGLTEKAAGFRQAEELDVLSCDYIFAHYAIAKLGED